MASLDYLEARYYAREPRVGRVTDDTPVMLRIKHVGSGTTQAPTVVVSNTASTLTLTDGAASATTIDLSAAAYDYMGELCDYINSLASWECKLLDALRADASNNVIVSTTVTAAVVNGETVFDILADTSATTKYCYRVTYDRGVQSNKPKGSHRVILKEIKYYADLTAGANGVKVYECKADGKTETLIWTAAAVDTTETTHDLNDGICPGEGNDLVVQVDATVVDNASGFLQCQYLRE